jgi:7,8-dihydroneopterin aldolase/epimerase/oxygenase
VAGRADVIWDFGRSYQRIGLEEVELDLRIGAYETERGAAQRVTVAVDLFRAAGPFRGQLDACLDYDRVRRYLEEVLPGRPHVDLLEELAENVIGFCFADPRVEACRVTLRKPAIYPGSARPVVEVYRRREDQG